MALQIVSETVWCAAVAQNFRMRRYDVCFLVETVFLPKCLKDAVPIAYVIMIRIRNFRTYVPRRQRAMSR